MLFHRTLSEVESVNALYLMVYNSKGMAIALAKVLPFSPQFCSMCLYADLTGLL
jgi:hypothetical protein